MAATIHSWTNGSANRNWGTSGNWTNGVPGSGGAGLDDAIFDGSITQVGPNAGMDRTADNTLKRIITLPNFRGDIGGTGNPLIHEVLSSSDGQSRIIHRGSGAFYFQGAVGSFNDMLVNARGGRTYLTGGGAGGGTIRNVFALLGYANIGADCNLTGVAFVGGAGAQLEIEADAAGESDPAYLLVSSGLLTNKRDIANTRRLDVLGGRCVQTGRIAGTAGSTKAVIYIAPAGILAYTPSNALSASHVPDLTCFGVLDLSASRQDIQFDNYVLGPLASVLGTVVQSGDISSLATKIDLREEFP